MASFSAGTTFTDGVANDVTAAKLAALVNAATPTSGLIQDRTAETTIDVNDTLLVGDASDSNNLKRMTVANFAGTLPTATITSGTVTNLASTTGTIATLNSTTGTITTGVIPTLTSTTLITTGTGTAASPAIVPTGDTNTGIFFPAADTIAFSEGGAEAMRIDSSGNVGIGTTSPAARLSVDSSTSGLYATFNSTSTNGGYLEFQSIGTVQGDIGTAKQIVSGSTSDFAVNARGARNLVLGTNNTERLRIDSSGKILSNGASNTYGGTGSLSLNALTGSAVDLELRVNNTLVGYLYNDSTNVQLANAQAGYLSMLTSNTERLRIDASGNCSIGTATAIGKLTVEAAGGGASTTPITTNSITGAGTRFAAAFYYSGTKVGSIDVTGSATAYVTSSDYRLKTNLEPIVNGINRIKQLPVYSFNWKIDESGNKVDGFVAHEAKAIVPESVTGEKDAVDSDGKPIYQGIDQSKIVPLLTAALKEAIAKIETLEAKVTALEAA